MRRKTLPDSHAPVSIYAKREEKNRENISLIEIFTLIYQVDALRSRPEDSGHSPCFL
jgi:hypothetical protein